jgi:hypothetical protein
MGMGLQYLGAWSNTGYMDLESKRKPLFTPVLDNSASALQPSTAISDPHALHFPQVVTELADPTTSRGVISMPSVSLDTGDTPAPPPKANFHRLSLMVKAVNSQDHLRDLKKTRGGIGNLKHDEKQTTMDSFVKRRKTG